MATVTLYLRGDQIGTYSSSVGVGIGAARVVTVLGVMRIGSASEIFTVTVEQVSGGVTEFQSGQVVTITNSVGTVIMPSTSINPNDEQGMAGGDEHLLISSENFLIDLGGVPVGPAVVLYGQTDQAANINEGDNDGNLDFLDFPCFTPGTMILTPSGNREVCGLMSGDLVSTLDHGAQPIRWIGQRTLHFASSPHPRQPILFQKGCHIFDFDRDTKVSPQHRMMLSGPLVQQMFGETQVLAPAKGLLALPGVRAMTGRKSETYISILLDRHEILQANGTASESFFPGKMGMRMLGQKSRRQVEWLFPSLRLDPENGYGPTARTCLTLQETRKLVELKLSNKAQTTISKADFAPVPLKLAS